MNDPLAPEDRIYFYALAKAMAVTIATYINKEVPRDVSNPEELFDRVLMEEMEEEGDEPPENDSPPTP